VKTVPPSAELRHDVHTIPRDLNGAETFCFDEPLTVEEFYEWANEDTNAELVDGVIVMQSPASVLHEILFQFLSRTLGDFVEARSLGTVLGSRTPLRINAYTVREPDLLFVRADRSHIIADVEVTAAPDLIIEIVPKHDSRRKIVSKQAEYDQVGVRELWIIDQPKKVLTVQVRNSQGKLAPREPDSEGRIVSEAVPGFWLMPDWLWLEASARPTSREVVSQLLHALT